MITCPNEFRRAELKPRWRYPIFEPAEIDAFNAVVFQHFSDGPYFAVQARGTINLDRVLADHANDLLSGACTYSTRKGGRRWSCLHEQLLFKMGDGAFIFIDSDASGVRAFATTREEASRWAKTFPTNIGTGRETRNRADISRF